MTTKDQAIALAIEDIERYQVKRQDFDRFSGTLLFLKEVQTQPPAPAPAPDCRTCANRFDAHYSSECGYSLSCTNGDKYQPAPAVVLWGTE